MYAYEMEHIFSYRARLHSSPEVIGPTPEGLRMNVYVTGGEVSGPRLNGELLAVGADWLTVRPDGVGIIDVRTTIKTNDGALIYAAYQGVADAGEDGYQRFLSGDAPPSMRLRAVPRFVTAHPDYLWLNRLQCVNIGEADLETWTVGYDVYALS